MHSVFKQKQVQITTGQLLSEAATLRRAGVQAPVRGPCTEYQDQSRAPHIFLNSGGDGRSTPEHIHYAWFTHAGIPLVCLSNIVMVVPTPISVYL
jgi:hypothetical protein